MTVEEDVEAFHNFSFGIMAAFASLVSALSIRLGEHRNEVVSSEYWSESDEKLSQGWKGVHKATARSIALCMLIIIASAIAIGLPSTDLDVRMTLILEGLSLLFAAALLGALSFHVAVWTGMHYKVWPRPKQEAPKSLKELQFKVRWSFYRIFGRYFFFLLPFYQGVRPWTIPISMLAGIALGVVVDWGVYICRRKQKRTRKIASGIFTFLLVCCSSIMLAIGVYYIEYVWDTVENPRRDVTIAVGFSLCLSVEGSLHFMKGRVSRKKFPSSNGLNSNLNPLALNRPHMAFSLITASHDLKKYKKNALRTSQAREPTRSSVALGTTAESSNSDGVDQQDVDIQNDTPSMQESSKEADDNVEVDCCQQDVVSQNETQLASIQESPKAVSTEVNNDHEKHSQNANGGEEDVVEPTYRQMFCAWNCAWKCCGCVRRDNQTTLERFIILFKWTIWFVLVAFSLYLVIVNLGSTYQQNHSRSKLPYVSSVLYDNRNEGPVCAFDNKGPDINITTFPDKDAAQDAGFLVVHCGACGACSDWHNLRVNYETREYLASASAACAKKALFGGAQAVQECLELPPIEFQGECAVCWTEDILCTKSFCSFIFLQSTMINTVSNFQVSKETITSASCEEAHCEARNPGDFVFCSGATRRRMNVTSTIDRPGAQRCGIVDVDWAEVFA